MIGILGDEAICRQCGDYEDFDHLILIIIQLYFLYPIFQIDNYINPMSKLIVKKIIDSGSNIDHRFIKDHHELKSVVDILKTLGYKIVLTQGVYDLIHEGHASYLE